MDPRPSLGSVLRWVSVAVAWFIVAAMAVLVLLRAGHVDQRTPEIAAVVLTPWLLLPAWPIAACALARRRWLLGAAAVAIVVIDIVWEGPILWPFAHAPSPAPGTVPWVLFDANVAQDNVDLTEISHEITTDRPTVITLQELTPPALRSLRSSGVLAGYPWSQVDARYGAGGMAIWARVPLTGTRTWLSDGTQVEIQTWIHPPRSPAVRLDVVHVYAPVGLDEPALWRQQLGQVEQHLRTEPRPLVVAGDFNATADVGPFQRIMHLGLSDAAVLEGKGWDMTWPRNQSWVIPYLRIDHVLLSSQLTVTGYRLGDGHGSDHHPLVVTVAAR